MAEVATKEAVAEQTKPVEKQTNCLACNKPLKKLKVYYRNGKFYCSKKCWLKTKASAQPQKETK